MKSTVVDISDHRIYRITAHCRHHRAGTSIKKPVLHIEALAKVALNGVLPSLAGREGWGRLDLYCDGSLDGLVGAARGCSAAIHCHFQLLL